ncbi:MAG: bacillithiol biosynthesis deacetylase BshB1 [Acidobacteria bacterium]|nr:MAG: bacillithiol biosynthesis deacetylase BshB1 [Acidobacteriota bacterium]
MKLDALAFGAHPDDIELVVSGTLLKLADLGYNTGVVDMVRGELGTRGTPQIRAREAQASARILSLKLRENLKLTDGQIFNTQPARLKVIRTLRKYRPSLVFTHYWDDKHPDHVHTSQIVTEACYLSGLAKIGTGQERFRPQKIFYFMLPHYVEPSFIVDISQYFDRKMQALRCFSSQLHDPKSREPQTYLSVPEFLLALESLHRYYGTLIQSKYAEAFYCTEVISIDDPVAFFTKRGRM